MMLADIILMDIIQRAIAAWPIVKSLSHEFAIDVAKFPTVWMHNAYHYRFNGSYTFVTLLLLFNYLLTLTTICCHYLLTHSCSITSCSITSCSIPSCSNNTRSNFNPKDLAVDLITKQFLCSFLDGLKFFNDNLIDSFFLIHLSINKNLSSGNGSFDYLV